MKIYCPKDSTHKEFSATAHVTEDWRVDETGTFVAKLETGDSQVVHRPDSQDLYTCVTCGTEAKVERD